MVKRTWQKIVFSLSFGWIYFWPKLAFGQLTCPKGTSQVGGTCVPTGGNQIFTLSQGVGFVLNIMLSIVGLVAVFFIVLGGFRYITSAGDEEQLKNAKGMIVNALIGVAVVLLALALVRIVSNLASTGAY